jgi:hypothetical protein
VRNQVSKPSRAERSNSPLDGSRNTGRPGRKARSSTRRGPAAPANKKGVLDGSEQEIRTLYADGKGRRISNIARTFNVSITAIRKVLGLTGKKTRLGGKRQSKCCQCWAPMAISAGGARGFCESCVQRACETITIYDRERGDTQAQLPVNLRRYLQG